VSDEQNMALPRLYGGPAYSRPPRPAQEIVRPFDPDELPLEAERTDGDPAHADQLMGNSWGPTKAASTKPKATRRGRAAKLAKGAGGLQGRPFRLRALGRMFGGDHK
jgi:hypothetical protein